MEIIGISIGMFLAGIIMTVFAGFTYLRRIDNKLYHEHYAYGQKNFELGWENGKNFCLEMIPSALEKHRLMHLEAINPGQIVLVSAMKLNDLPKWMAMDNKGRRWHLKFQDGVGTIGPDEYRVNSSFNDSGQPDITFEDMCAYLGVAWSPSEDK